MKLNLENTLCFGTDYYCKETDTWYCIGYNDKEPVIIGQYSGCAVRQNSEFQEKASGLIWGKWLNE